MRHLDRHSNSVMGDAWWARVDRALEENHRMLEAMREGRPIIPDGPVERPVVPPLPRMFVFPC